MGCGQGKEVYSPKIQKVNSRSELGMATSSDLNGIFHGVNESTQGRSYQENGNINQNNKKPIQTGSVRVEIIESDEQSTDQVVAKITRFSPKKRYKNSIDQLSASPSTASTAATADILRNIIRTSVGVVPEKSEFEESGTNHDLTKTR